VSHYSVRSDKVEDLFFSNDFIMGRLLNRMVQNREDPSRHFLAYQMRQSFVDYVLTSSKETVVKDPLVYPVAVFNHVVGGGDHFVYTFYSNGSIGTPNDRSNWSIDNNNQLILRWPKSDAPGGQWIDVCTLSPGGQTYRGRNQQGVTIQGYMQ
jgi:hypothetical protein